VIVLRRGARAIQSGECVNTLFHPEMVHSVFGPGKTFDRLLRAFRAGGRAVIGIVRPGESYANLSRSFSGVYRSRHTGRNRRQDPVARIFPRSPFPSRPGPVILGIFIATVANHAFAAAVGTWLTHWLGPDTLRWLLGLSFLAMAIWVLIPDKLDESEISAPRLGVLGATILAFFLAEMGDKTQIATVALAAQYEAFVAVVMGTTLGMMIANVPAVYAGDRLAHRLPVRLIHVTAAALFALLGIAILMSLF